VKQCGIFLTFISRVSVRVSSQSVPFLSAVIHLSAAMLPVLHVEIDNGFHQNPVIVLSHSLCLVTDSTVRLRSCFLSNVYVCDCELLLSAPLEGQLVVLSLLINTVEVAGFNPSQRTDYLLVISFNSLRRNLNNT
jgi:hypothetical protein